MSKLAFLFPGQGSQQVGMGAQLRSERPELFERYFALAEEASGLPLGRLALEGPIEELTRTDVAQPALFSLSLALHEAAEELGLRPALVAGHSLGEYTAAVAGGALGVQDGMRLVARRGRLMAEIQSSTPGTMAAILGLDSAAVEQLCEAARDHGEVGLANLNSPQQIVVSGAERAVERVVELADAAGARRAMRLQVGAAFHSPMMESVAEQLAGEMDGLSFADPQVPIVSNASGGVLRTGAEVRQGLIDQIARPVLWARCVETLIGEGCRSFLEVGPGRVLAGLVRQLDRSVETATADSIEKLSQAAASHATQPRSLHPRIHVITLGVDDLERALAFYRDGLGLASEGITGTQYPGDDARPAGAVAMFKLEDGLILSLYPRTELAKDAHVAVGSTSGSGVSIGHIVDSREDVDRVLQLAGRAGAQVLGAAHERPWGIYSGYFSDPDGHLWEVLCVLPEDRAA